MSDTIEMVAEPEKAPPVGPKRSPHDWAERKKIGHLAHAQQTTEAREKAMRHAILTGCVKHNRWPVGAELTEAEFDAGLAGFMEDGA